jgi:diguanylate cyclase (GGDEF)-like protein/PAS domain S-box-containing protein
MTTTVTSRHHRRWTGRELDPLELQFRLDSVPAAVAATVLVCPAALVYVAVAGRPGNRLVLSLIAVVAIGGSLMALALPWERMLRSRWREAYYIVWWLIDLAAVMAAVALDGGPRSPLLVLVFILLVFIGFSYPRASVVFLVVVTLIGYSVMAGVYGERPAAALLIATALAATGAMSYWQTLNHDRRRRALTGSHRELEAALARAETSMRALERSESGLSEAQAIAHLGSWELELPGNRLSVSAELRRIAGMPAGGLPLSVRDFLAHVYPSDRQRVGMMVQDAIRTGRPFSDEHRIVRPDGEIRTLLTRGEVRGKAGERPHVRAVCQDITELRSVEARLRHQADHDDLTGLFNRSRLADEIDRQRSYGTRSARAGALLVIDIDSFGFYNDSHGQPAGDALLRSFANVLAARLRATDFVARSGGDEFAAVLPEATEENALVIAEQLRSLLSGCAPGEPISCSAGIAMFGQNLGLDGDDVLGAADIALHDAKQRGGNKTAVYQGDAGTDMTWVQKIRAALAEDRFVLYGQPIIDLETGAVSHHELLIRMLDDDGGVIAPGDFLPAAERFGLINEIDRWVTSEALNFARDGYHVALNLSARSLGDMLLLQSVREAITRGVDPANLVFEITETAAVSNLADARAFAGELTDLGCDVAIDDFGTGFGAFTYLKHVPSRYVKIDIEFIRDLTTSPTDREVVSAIVGIARSLGKRTIAEGVEDAATMEAIRELGVDYAQGFYTGRPQRMSVVTGFERRSGPPSAGLTRRAQPDRPAAPVG